jgi:tRNA threonylcarbamoyl adenosine modification protein YeaZ
VSFTRKLVAIETTCRVTSVALFDGGELKGTVQREAKGDGVLVLVDMLLRAHGLSARDVARWAVDIGPGSFTGVRIGVATVKGLAFATGAEVVAVNAFDALCETSGAVPKGSVVLVEAGKGEVYFRIGADEPGHARLAAVRERIDGGAWTVIGPDVLPNAEAVGRVAHAHPPEDLDLLAPLYVRAPDLTRPR